MSVASIQCPGCGSGDLARQVSAVVLDGQTTIHLSGTYAAAVGWTPASGVISQSGQSTTTAANLLAPPPLPPPRTDWYVWIVVLATYCLCWAGLGVASWPDLPPTPTVAPRRSSPRQRWPPPA